MSQQWQTPQRVVRCWSAPTNYNSNDSGSDYDNDDNILNFTLIKIEEKILCHLKVISRCVMDGPISLKVHHNSNLMKISCCFHLKSNRTITKPKRCCPMHESVMTCFKVKVWQVLMNFKWNVPMAPKSLQHFEESVIKHTRSCSYELIMKYIFITYDYDLSHVTVLFRKTLFWTLDYLAKHIIFKQNQIFHSFKID